jgi:hypothetical protein
VPPRPINLGTLNRLATDQDQGSSRQASWGRKFAQLVSCYSHKRMHPECKYRRGAHDPDLLWKKATQPKTHLTGSKDSLKRSDSSLLDTTLVPVPCLILDFGWLNTLRIRSGCMLLLKVLHNQTNRKMVYVSYQIYLYFPGPIARSSGLPCAPQP